MATPIINEFELADFVRCPLRVEAVSGLSRESRELEAAKVTVKWLLLLTFRDKLPALAAVRRKLDEEWEKAEDCLEVETVKYRGLVILPRIAGRLLDLAVNFIVAHPVTPYALSFGRNQVTGEYAALIPPKPQGGNHLLLRLQQSLEHVEQVDLLKRGPDTVNMLRWLHFRQWEPEHPLTQVLNWSIDSEESWTDFYDEQVIRKYLEAVSLNRADGRLYPVPGPHCASCRLHICNMDAQEVCR